jgi:hypothetical protein
LADWCARRSSTAEAISRSDGYCELVEGDAEPVAGGGVVSEFVVAAAAVLHEYAAGGQDPRGPVPFQAAHRPEPGLQPPVISLDTIIGVLLSGVQR